MKAILPDQIGEISYVRPNEYVRGAMFHRGQADGLCWKVLDWSPAQYGQVNLKVWYLPTCKDRCVES